MSKVVLTKEIAQQFIADEDSVDLSEFTSIEDNAAAVLGTLCSEFCYLDLRGLGRISDDSIKSLVKCRVQVLCLDGIAEINDHAAKCLSACDSKLRLHGVQKLSDTALENLANRDKGTDLNYELTKRIITFRGPLTQEIAQKFIDDDLIELSDFTEITEDAASVLSDYDEYSLDLESLTTISVEVARSLSKAKVESLSLSGLEEIGDDVAKELSNFSGESLWLSGITKLSESAAQSLSLSCVKQLCLGEIQAIDEAVAAQLSKFNGDLSLESLSYISDEAAEHLSHHAGELRLHGLPRLSANATKSFVKKDSFQLLLSEENSKLVMMQNPEHRLISGNRKIWINRNGKTFGPYKEEDVVEYVFDKVLFKNDLCWSKGSDWLSLDKITPPLFDMDFLKIVIEKWDSDEHVASARGSIPLQAIFNCASNDVGTTGKKLEQLVEKYLGRGDSGCMFAYFCARNCCGVDDRELPGILSEEEDFELTSAADEAPAIWYSCQKIASELLSAQVFQN